MLFGVFTSLAASVENRLQALHQADDTAWRDDQGPWIKPNILQARKHFESMLFLKGRDQRLQRRRLPPQLATHDFNPWLLCFCRRSTVLGHLCQRTRRWHVTSLPSSQVLGENGVAGTRLHRTVLLTRTLLRFCSSISSLWRVFSQYRHC
jgi:hypothetical protein